MAKWGALIGSRGIKYVNVMRPAEFVKCFECKELVRIIEGISHDPKEDGSGFVKHRHQLPGNPSTIANLKLTPTMRKSGQQVQKRTREGCGYPHCTNEPSREQWAVRAPVRLCNWHIDVMPKTLRNALLQGSWTERPGYFSAAMYRWIKLRVKKFPPTKNEEK